MVLKSVLVKLFELLLSIIVMFLVYLILILLLPPLLIYKKLVQILGKFYNPNLSGMLSGFSAIFATRLDNYESPTLTLVSTHSIEIENKTVVNMEKVFSICADIANSKDFSNFSKLFVKFMGYYFWEDNPNFNIKDMITLHSEPLGFKELQKIRKDFQSLSFRTGYPPWEMHIYENYSDGHEGVGKKRIAVVNRAHHCLHDWISILNVINEVATALGTVPTNIKTKDRKTDRKDANNIFKIFETFKQICNLLVFGPYETLKMFVIANQTTLGKSVGNVLSWECYNCETKVSLNYVKEISKRHNVGSPSVSFAALTGAMRTLLIEKEVKPLPQTVSISGPFALPWKLDGLNDHFTTIPVSLPVGIPDPVSRLKVIDKMLRKLQHKSPLPLGFFAMFSIIGSLPFWLTKYMFEFPVLSASYSIAPGFSDYNERLGLNVTDFRIAGGMPFGNVTILGLYSVSLNGILNLRAEGDRSIFPKQEDCERFLNNFIEELNILSLENHDFIVVHNKYGLTNV